MDLKLKFVNHSNDADQSQVIIFQKPVSAPNNEDTIAWKVIGNSAQGDQHSFVYEETLQVAVEDSNGNITPAMDAYPGQLYDVQLTPSGIQLIHVGPSSNQNEIQVLNALPKETVNVYCYRSGKKLAHQLSVPPHAKAVFEFSPHLYIGVQPGVEESQVMHPAVVSKMNTKLSLEGLKSADIVMTGGGSGQDATAYNFNLENKQLR